MELKDVTATEWFICESVSEYIAYGAKLRRKRFIPGVKGYIKRNQHTPNYFQVLLRDKDGRIDGFYIEENEAKSTVTPLKQAPAAARPQSHWIAVWDEWK